MKKIRLLVTDICNRNCEGCCNKDWDLKALPSFSKMAIDWKDTECVMITGGEPLLFPELVKRTIKEVKERAFKQKGYLPIHVYTAKTSSIDTFLKVLNEADGVTLTLHEQADVDSFIKLNLVLLMEDRYKYKSKKLNIFKGVNIDSRFIQNWDVKDNIEWIKDCPLPEDEIFVQL